MLPEHPKHARIGENGRTLKEFATDFVSKEKHSKPIVASIDGGTAPPEERIDHADTIISGRAGTAQNKINAFKAVGIEVAENP